MKINSEIKNLSGNKINIDLRYPESEDKKIPLLVFCHGFKGFKNWGSFPYVLDKVSLNGIFCVSFNFSHNGTDNEKPEPVDFERLDLFAQNTFTKELDDLKCVIDYLERQKDKYNYDFNSLVLAGHSRGGGIAILKTAEDNRVKKLITLSSVSAFGRYGDETVKRWKENGFIEILNTRTNQKMRMNYSLYEDLENNKERLDIQKAAYNVNVPFLIIHGTEDLAVDISEAETLYSLSNKKIAKIVKIDNTGHTFGAVHPFKGTTPALEKVINEIISFISGNF